MNSKKIKISSGIFIFLFFASLFTNAPVRGEDDDKEYEQYLKKPSLHSTVINFLRKERKVAKPVDFDIKDYAIIFSADFFLSALCLWLAIYFVTWKKTLITKPFVWFLFVINFGWFIFLLVLKVIWQILDFLVIKLRPELGALVLDNFSLILIIIAVLIYIWFLARTFELTFFGALKTLLFSHVPYLVIIFVFFLIFDFKENSLFELAKHKLGAKAIIRSYILDTQKISSGADVLTYIRIRPYHL